MPKRKRLEDFGYLLRKLEELDESEVLQPVACRTKDYPEFFRSLSEEDQYDVLYKTAYGLRKISEDLAECILIARGHHDD